MKALIENEVDISRPPEEVFDYASDHTHEPEWNPAMRSMRKLTDGPVGLGTRYEMEFVPGKPMVATCDAFDRPRSWSASGRTLAEFHRLLATRGDAYARSAEFGLGMDVTLGGQVVPTPTGSHLVFRTVFRGHGIKAILESGTPTPSSGSATREAR